MSIINELYNDIKSFNINVKIKNNILIILEKNIVFECCVFKDFCESNIYNHKYYHINKLNRWVSAGYRFYIIFEDEYKYKYDITIARIKNLLNLNTGKKIYARKCVVREISTKESSLFIKKFHIQGNSGARVKLGAFIDEGLFSNKLVSCMTFGKPSRAKGNKFVNDGDWELIRFCSDPYYRCIGTASKLLKHFERNYNWNKIISFADRRWSFDGNLYKVLGFTLESITQPNYYYLKLPNYTHRTHRFAFRRNVLRDRALVETNLSKEVIFSKTEFELAKILGYDRVWDCGNLKYVLKNNN